MSNLKKIIDVCCGSKMFWFNKNHPDVIYQDIREESHVLCDDRELVISPDVIGDFRKMDYPDESFKLVVFDPPHLNKLGKSSWMAKKYGVLLPTWELDIKSGFEECFRILQKDGILIFKWNENQIPLNRILDLTDKKPLFGHTSGKKGQTHWVTFMK